MEQEYTKALINEAREKLKRIVPRMAIMDTSHMTIRDSMEHFERCGELFQVADILDELYILIE